MAKTVYAPKELEIGKHYECIEYDFQGKEHDFNLREFLSYSVNMAYPVIVERKDENGVYFYPYKDSKEYLFLPFELNAEFEDINEEDKSLVTDGLIALALTECYLPNGRNEISMVKEYLDESEIYETDTDEDKIEKIRLQILAD